MHQRVVVTSLTAFIVACGSGSSTTPSASSSGSESASGAKSSASASSGSQATGGSSSGASSDADGAACATGTEAVECDYEESTFNDTPSVNATSVSKWTCSGTTRSLTANGLPDHATGTFPNENCPNTIASQSVSATFTLTPAYTGTATSWQPTGYQLNGVKYDPGTAGSCSSPGADGGVSCTLLGNDGSWNIEALGDSTFNFGVDSSNAHVQPNGSYHYHGMPEATLAKLNKGMTPTLVGFANDGFPMYARYGYSSAMDATSPVKVIKGSYQLKTTPDSGRPPTSTYPLGIFSEDWEYVAGSGDLDQCNGRFDVTPEFPCGIYHYYITDTYPYIGRCLMGTPRNSEVGSGGGMTGSGSGMTGSGSGMTGGVDGGSCASASDCSSSDVCCPTGQPCAGTCVPNCAMTGACPSGTTCDTSSGVCTP